MKPSTRSAQRLFTSPAISHSLTQTSRLTPLIPRSALQPVRRLPRQSPLLASSSFNRLRRYNSSLAVPGDSQNPSPADESSTSTQQPAYSLTFTCRPCKHRSSHRISKQGYHHGTVLIQCPSCKNRHVIADHLKIFMDKNSTLEDILRAKLELRHDEDLGKVFKKGQLGIRQGELVGNEGEEDIEFWDDGSVSVHKPGT